MALRVTLDLYTHASGRIDKNGTRFEAKGQVWPRALFLSTRPEVSADKYPMLHEEPYIVLLLLCACVNHHECNNSDVTSTRCSAYV